MSSHPQNPSYARVYGPVLLPDVYGRLVRQDSGPY